MHTLYSHNDYNYAYPTFDDKYLFEQKKQDFNTISVFFSNIKDYLQLSVKVIQGSRLSENQGQEVCIMPLKGLVPFLVLMETKIFKDYYVLLTSRQFSCTQH